MEERRIVAIHEAGHVAMRCIYGIPTPKFEINDEGTGITIASGAPIWDVSVQLDTSLAGMTAEEILTRKAVLTRSDQDIQDAIDEAGEGDQDPDWQTDLDQSVDILIRRCRGITDNEIIQRIRASYSRCQKLLSQRWTVVEKLADKALDSLDGSVSLEEIEAIWKQDNLTRS